MVKKINIETHSVINDRLSNPKGLPQRHNKRWTPQAIRQDAKKYSCIAEWAKESGSSYKAAMRLRIKDECAKHMINPNSLPRIWTVDKIRLEAEKYHNKREWVVNSASSYAAAIRLNILSECIGHMDALQHEKWTPSSIMEEAKKYSSRAKWWRYSGSSHCAARRLGILEECAAHMISTRQTWTAERILLEAKKYSHLSEWKHYSSGSFNKAKILGIFDRCVIHMVRIGGTSLLEQDLLHRIQLIFPTARRVKMGKQVNGQYGKQFELDIYIPELRKGIEFNGTYWHSEQGLKRGRPDWPQEMIQNYHELKKAFFAKQNIQYLDISEQDWTIDNQECLVKIESFLGCRL